MTSERRCSRECDHDRRIVDTTAPLPHAERPSIAVAAPAGNPTAAVVDRFDQGID
jgi:hypothetical protein